MELKKYQEDVLKDLDTYIENILFTGNPGTAYDKLWRDKGVRVGGADGMQLYKDVITGVPTVCLKVPTGGGKTILGCASLKHIFDAMDERKKKVVVWLVPWETILTQTYDNLSNVNHFYRERLNRDFSSKVEVYNKKQALNGVNFNPTTINDQLSIILMSFDSLRTTNKEGRKVYEENSNLMPFVSTYSNRDELIKNVDDSALMQVLNQLRPVVIIDESHNAKTELSKEMIKNLNPSFVVELTATPKKDSNIISIVSANQLKEENMVKLPVIAYNRPSVERVVSEALDLRNSLEKAAIFERKNNGAPYIRPIILFQAQPKNDDDSVTFDRVKKNLIDAGIPEDEIAIKTANKNELNGIDLMSENCKIRYIITINALKEGWDCPFAYVLASLANRTSKIDVEQILGRILRQPYTKRYFSKILNMSYVLTSSADFQSTLQNILDGLNVAGFSKNDVRYVNTNTLDNLSENLNDANESNIFDNQRSEAQNINNDIFSVEVVRQQIEHNNVDDSINFSTPDNNPNASFTNNESLNKMINQAVVKSDEYESQVEEAKLEGTINVPGELQTYTNMFSVKEEFRDEIKELKLPIFAFKKTGTLFDDDNSVYPVDINYLNDGYNLDLCPNPNNITSSSDIIYKVDVETSAEGSIIKKSMLNREDSEQFKSLLSLIPEGSRVITCKKRLVEDINKKFNNIPYNSIVRFIDRVVDSLKTEDEMIALQNNIYTISARLKDYINNQLKMYRYENFKNKLDLNQIFISYDYQLKLSITLPNHTDSYLKTLYKEEDNDVDSLEEKFMAKISSLNNVKWWHRNVDRVEFAINGYLNHFPDFIVETKNGIIIMVETKGEHLDGDDSKLKLELGRKWADKTDGRFKYFMAFDHSPLVQDGSDLLDNIIHKISQL